MAASKIHMRRNMAIIMGITLLCLLAVVGKLVILQFVQGEELQIKAESYRTREETVSASRGSIYDRNGVLLAFSTTADSIGAYTRQVKDSGKATDIAYTLSTLLDMDMETIYDKITSDDNFVWLQRKVDADVAKMIEFYNLPGIAILEESQRYYPQETLASQLIGFAGIDNQGLEGLEVALDEWLAGVDGSIIGQYDAEGRLINSSDYAYVPPLDGYDVYLTIDSNIQYYCERELSNMMNSENPPKRAGILVMDPKTGALLAMAMTNGYDPNNYGDYDSSTWRNWLLSDSYEPGSTFKTITLSAALEEGTVSAGSLFPDDGYIRVADSTIKCWTSVPHGMQTLSEAVANSCNPAFVQIGQTLENKEKGLLYKYITAFGFGTPTNIGLSGEAPGILQAEANRGPVELATSSIGQGIAVTPLQMITAECAVANGGYLLRPQLVAEVRSETETIYSMEREVVRQVISESTSEQVRDMLIGVVTDGSGALAAIEGYTIGGKTGTAQKAEAGVYATGKYVGSFIGLVPADDPQLVCLVVVDEPSGGNFYGSQVAAPVFRAVMSDSLTYLGILPSENARDGVDNSAQSDPALSREVQVPNVVNMDAENALATMRAAGLNVTTEGEGPLVTSQLPLALSYADRGADAVLYLGGKTTDSAGNTTVTVPDLGGKRLAEVAGLLSSLELRLAPVGSGQVVTQNPAPGSQVPAGTSVSVYFQEPVRPNTDKPGSDGTVHDDPVSSDDIPLIPGVM